MARGTRVRAIIGGLRERGMRNIGGSRSRCSPGPEPAATHCGHTAHTLDASPVRDMRCMRDPGLLSNYIIKMSIHAWWSDSSSQSDHTPDTHAPNISVRKRNSKEERMNSPRRTHLREQGGKIRADDTILSAFATRPTPPHDEKLPPPPPPRVDSTLQGATMERIWRRSCQLMQKRAQIWGQGPRKTRGRALSPSRARKPRDTKNLALRSNRSNGRY